jgi:hypothetical protein
VLFASALSGLTFFQRQQPYERLSAYRFHNLDPLVMVDGGSLTWQVGAQSHPGASKCGNPLPSLPPGMEEAGQPWALLSSRPGLNASRTLSPVNVSTYAWIYAYPGPFACSNSSGEPQCSAAGVGAAGWPSGWNSSSCCEAPAQPPMPPPGPPAPTPAPIPGPPASVGCASGFCAAFCSNAAVRGCAAEAAASTDLRAARTGRPCGGPLGPCSGSLADACAEGWGLCLAGAASDAAQIASFRANMSAQECSGSAADARAFVGAMSHALPAWSGLPAAGKPCPAEPVQADNGCAASGWGAEPVCCGGGCAVPSCPNSLWVGGTRIHEDEGSGCGGLRPGAVQGVLCCRQS